MLTTRRADWDRNFRMLRQHGMSVSTFERHLSSNVVFETYEEPGFNYRMTDVQAAIGLQQLRRLRDEAVGKYPTLTGLSMGMSNDFVTAIEEGSTCVRIGTAIFGKRQPPPLGDAE